jgi:hypothetical protein
MNSWITVRVPTADDANPEGLVRIPRHYHELPLASCGHWQDYRLVVPGQPWWSRRAAAVAQEDRPDGRVDKLEKRLDFIAGRVGELEAFYSQLMGAQLRLIVEPRQ